MFIPPELKAFKLHLFERIGETIGFVLRHDFDHLVSLPEDVIPIIGCSYELRKVVVEWKKTGREFIYWDRGYARRIFATWLPPGDRGGYYRWHRNAYQMTALRDVPPDRWERLKTPLAPWSRRGSHIVVATPSVSYQRFHGIDGWEERTVARLREITDRPVITRGKESTVPLQKDIAGAHALVTHGSNAATEAVIMGCPVFVDPSSAAALVGETDIEKINNPVYPDRHQWVNSLAYCQYTEDELCDGTLWRLIQ